MACYFSSLFTSLPNPTTIVCFWSIRNSLPVIKSWRHTETSPLHPPCLCRQMSTLTPFASIEPVYHYSFSLRTFLLHVVVVSASTTTSGSSFQIFTTLFVKNQLRIILIFFSLTINLCFTSSRSSALGKKAWWSNLCKVIHQMFCSSENKSNLYNHPI